MAGRLVYFIGIPGAGKTTLMDKLLEGRTLQFSSTPFEHGVFPLGDKRGCYLGGLRPPFSGTDTLSRQATPIVSNWLDTCPYDLVLGEGYNLCNEKFFVKMAQKPVWELFVVLLHTPLEMAAQRRERREQRGASVQRPPWVLATINRVYNLKTWVTLVLDGRKPVDELVSQLTHYSPLEDLFNACE